MLHVRHWPRACALLQNSHVAGKVFSSISVEVWVWRGNCDLLLLSSARLIIVNISTYQMEDCTRQNAIDSVIDASLHAEKPGYSKRLQNTFL
jgi:hypothetical protein